MSKIALAPSASGTGTLTISAPNTNSDRVLNLPDNSGTLLSNASTAGFPAGSVLQVVQAGAGVANFSTSSTSFQATGWTTTITPSSATSKILVLFSFQSWQNLADYTQLALYRGGVNISGSSNNVWAMLASPVGYNNESMTKFLDSPNTTSAITYQVYAKSFNGNTIYVGDNSYGVPRLTLMEIAA